ncbi:MAG TPA: hypothetical protein VIH03_07240 [Nitrososphaerales archaeon]
MIVEFPEPGARRKCFIIQVHIRVSLDKRSRAIVGVIAISARLAESQSRHAKG